MDPAWLLPTAPLFPLMLAALATFPRLRKPLFYCLPLAPLPALLLTFLLPVGTRIDLPHTLLQASWELDDIGRLFQLFTAAAWGFASLMTVATFRHNPRRGSFLLPFLTAMSGNLVLPTAADAVTYYSGFAVMSFASWGLVIHSGTPEARKAGRIYLTLVVLGELLIFPALVKGALWSGSAQMSSLQTHWALDPNPQLPLLLIFAGFAIKVGLFPAHFWLPLAHPAAPAPASAVLSGCMIKAGLLGWIRLLPLGNFPLPDLASLVSLLAAVGMIGGLILALGQQKPKALLAYSSVSKLSAVTLILAPALRFPDLLPVALTAALTLAAFHALHKSALFLGATLTPDAPRWLTLPLLLLCASFAGTPGLAGAATKEPLKTFFAHPELQHAPWIPLLFTLSTLLTLPVMARFLRLTAPQATSASRLTPARFIWLLAAIFALTGGYFLPAPALIQPPTLPQIAKGWLDPALLAGLALCLPLLRRTPLRAPSFPPGDLLSLLQKLPRPNLTPALRLIDDLERNTRLAPGGFLYILLILLLVGVLWPG